MHKKCHKAIKNVNSSKKVLGLLKFRDMLTANTIKLIKSLQQKKYRKQTGLFIAEGQRLVDDLLTSSLQIKNIYFTELWNNAGHSIDNRFVKISPKDMARISGLITASPVLAVVRTPQFEFNINKSSNSLMLALDSVQDPGNMGTIIRLADWFGIREIICTPDSADAFAPKVVQATMGAIARVRVIYTNLATTIADAKMAKVPVYGTFLDGNNIYTHNLQKNGIVVLGNEGNGISVEIENLISEKITIPSFVEQGNTSESLNVAMSTAIICSEFRRRMV